MTAEPRCASISLAAIVAEAALVLLAWSQTWFLLRLSRRRAARRRDSVAGGALLPLALASLALVAALALAGPVFRVVLGRPGCAAGRRASSPCSSGRSATRCGRRCRC